MDKTKEELEQEIQIFKCQERQRGISDKKYAIKLIETIVFTLISLILVGVIGSLIKLVLIK